MLLALCQPRAELFRKASSVNPHDNLGKCGVSLAGFTDGDIAEQRGEHLAHNQRLRRRMGFKYGLGWIQSPSS